MKHLPCAPDGADQASRPGKVPTTSVRRWISWLRRSWGLLLQTCRQITLVNAVNAV
jgi:hypothetical protein